MTKKKVLLIAAAMILVCALSVAGTLALMKLDTTNAPVENTFIAAGGGKLADTLTLTEHKLVTADDGTYSLHATETSSNNDYTVMPGMVLPKDPTITVTGKTTAPAYLYVEVVGTLPTAYSWEMADGWTLVSDLTGAKGGAVYVYEDILKNATDEPTTFTVIKGNKITVAKDPTDLNTSSTSLTFYAYLAQSTIGTEATPASVYTACFKSST